MSSLPPELRAVLASPEGVSFLVETLADSEIETLELLGRGIAEDALELDAALLSAVRDRGDEMIDKALVLLLPSFERGPSEAGLTLALELEATAEGAQLRYDLALALAAARAARGPQRELDKALDRLLAARLPNPTMQRLVSDKIRAARRR